MTDMVAFGGFPALGEDRTVEDALARELRRAILDGRLAPGTRLPYRALAAQFDVSVTPVRIALRELAHEGLVETRPHKGTRVTPLSLSEFEELYAARTGFEGWLARHGASELSGALRNEMDTHLRRGEEAAKTGDLDGYLKNGWIHRSVCYRAARRPALFARAEGLYRRSTRYNWLTLNHAGRLEESLAGARAFHAACLVGDGVGARDAIRATLEQTMEHILSRFVETRAEVPDDETAVWARMARTCISNRPLQAGIGGDGDVGAVPEGPDAEFGRSAQLRSTEDGVS